MTPRWRIDRGSAQDLPDVAALVARLTAPPAGDPLRGWFRPDEPVVVTRAPGRLDVMGGIADYSGSLVLELPLREAVLVALQRRAERVLEIVSPAQAGGRSSRVTIPLTELEQDGGPLDYPAARARLSARPEDRWAAYVAGAFVVLMRDKGCRLAGGLRLLVESAVPEGKGVSSSAALEVAAMQAIAAACQVTLLPRELALLCQRVENHVVGAPCGIMDQMTSACGEADHLLALRCQPCEPEGQVAVPERIALFGIDSGVRHAVSGADYGQVRAAAFMGYRILARARGCAARPADGRVAVDDPEWHGHLANCTPEVFHRELARHLPERMRGAEFLARYQGTTDPVTTVAPEGEYPVRAATVHPIEEHARVVRFRELLGRPLDARVLGQLGELMFQSHASYSACGLGCAATDWLVERVRIAAQAGAGVHGAKITGGGSGGTVAILGERGRAEAVVARIAAEHAARQGQAPQVFTGSSPGAVQFGALWLWPEVP